MRSGFLNFRDSVLMVLCGLFLSTGMATAETMVAKQPAKEPIPVFVQKKSKVKVIPAATSSSEVMFAQSQPHQTNLSAQEIWEQAFPEVVVKAEA